MPWGWCCSMQEHVPNEFQAVHENLSYFVFYFSSFRASRDIFFVHLLNVNMVVALPKGEISGRKDSEERVESFCIRETVLQDIERWH